MKVYYATIEETKADWRIAAEKVFKKAYPLIAFKGKVYSTKLVRDSDFSTIEEAYLFEVSEMHPAPPKFNRTFESLYEIAMNMADKCIANKTIEQRFAKLHEEFQEVVQSLDVFLSMQPVRIYEGKPCFDGQEYQENADELIKELSDVLFVLLHIGHVLGPRCTAFNLLHMAVTKMLARMNDPEYQAKI